MRKVWKSFLLCMLMIMTMTCTVFANVSIIPHVDGNKITIEGKSDHPSQYVMMQTWNGDKKYQIDADITDKLGNFKFQFNTKSNLDYDGMVNVGGELKEFKFSTKGTLDSKEIQDLKIIDKDVKLQEGENKNLQINVIPNNIKVDNILWKTSDEKIATVDNMGQVKAIKEGSAEITVMVGDKKDVCKVTVVKKTSSGGGSVSSPIKPQEKQVTVYMRVEGYDKTIIKRTKVKVGLFDLNPYLGGASGSSATKSKGWGVDKFKEPSNAHAIVKLLNDNNIKYDLQDYGWSTYMSMINGDREFDQGPMSGWMYSVNGQLPPVGCNAKPLRDGDEILWFYGAYGFKNIVTDLKVKNDKTNIKVDEEIELSLSGFKSLGASGSGQVDSYGRSQENVADATILVNGEEYKVDSKVVKTDENGNAKIKFKENGKYEISATRKSKTGSKKIDIVRPQPVIITVGSGVSSSGGAGGSSAVSEQKNKAVGELEKKLDNISIKENELNVEKRDNVRIVDISENIISAKVVEAEKIINKIKDKYSNIKLNDDVNVIQIKINDKDDKSTIFKLEGSSINYLKGEKFKLKVSFDDSQIKIDPQKVNNVDLDNKIEIRKSSNPEKVVKATLDNKKIVTCPYIINVYKINKDKNETKISLNGMEIGLKVNDISLKNISKKSLQLNMYDDSSKSLKKFKSKYDAKDNMVIAEIK